MPLSDDYPEMKGWVPAKPDDSTKTPTIPDDTVNSGRFLRAPLPLPLQYSPDSLRQYNRPGLSSFRIAPLPPGGVPAINSASAGVTKTIVQNNGSGILLETGGVPNANQSVLNLLAGSNIQVASDVNGGVTISGTAGGDGVHHGDPIWGLDSAWIDLRDDFGMVSTDVSTTVGNFTSELAWVGVDGSGGRYQPFHSFSFPNFGLLFMGASATADTQSFLIPHLASTSVQQYGWPLFDYPGWKLVWVFGINRKGAGTVPPAFDWSHVSNYIGLGSWPGQTSNTPPIVRPPYFAGLRYDTDATAPAISDTQFVFEYVAQAPVAGAPARNNTQGQTQATGINAVEGNFYRFEMTYLTDGQLLYSLSDGTTTFTKTFTIARLSIAPTATLSVSNGIAVYTAPGSKNQPQTSGSKIILTGITGTASTLNGTWVAMPANLQFLNAEWLTSVTPFGSTAATNGVTTLYPAMVPFISFGNSSQAGPTADTKGILVDFFGFVWNPGLNNAVVTPNVNKSRYF